MSYEFLEHTADVKFIAKGKSIEDSFSECAKALFETMYEGVKIEGKKEKVIEVKGDDLKSLLYNFLEEFIFLLDSEDFVCSGLKSINVEDSLEESGLVFILNATVIGDFALNYTFTNSVKAPTYNDMNIEIINDLYEIICVLDV